MIWVVILIACGVGVYMVASSSSTSRDPAAPAPAKGKRTTPKVSAVPHPEPIGVATRPLLVISTAGAAGDMPAMPYNQESIQEDINKISKFRVESAAAFNARGARITKTPVAVMNGDVGVRVIDLTERQGQRKGPIENMGLLFTNNARGNSVGISEVWTEDKTLGHDEVRLSDGTWFKRQHRKKWDARIRDKIWVYNPRNQLDSPVAAYLKAAQSACGYPLARVVDYGGRDIMRANRSWSYKSGGAADTVFTVIQTTIMAVCSAMTAGIASSALSTYSTFAQTMGQLGISLAFRAQELTLAVAEQGNWTWKKALREMVAEIPDSVIRDVTARVRIDLPDPPQEWINLFDKYEVGRKITGGHPLMQYYLANARQLDAGIRSGMGQGQPAYIWEMTVFTE